MKLTIEVEPDEIPVCRHCGEPVVSVLLGQALSVKHASGLYACCQDCPTVAEIWLPGTCRDCGDATEWDARYREFFPRCGGCEHELVTS